MQSLSSSGQSQSHSSDREEQSEAGVAAAGSAGTSAGLSVPRAVVRSASAEEATTHSALTTKFKRERFLKRQKLAVEETEAEWTTG